MCLSFRMAPPCYVALCRCSFAVLRLLRVGLSPPELSLRMLANFLRDMPLVQQARVISHEYAARVRDAFAELVKGLGKEQVAQAMLAEPNSTVYLCHCHDEAPT